MLTGAVFDMDGLMFDSERLVYETWQAMMDENGYSYSLDVFKTTIGLRRVETEKIYKSIYSEAFDYNFYKEQSRKRFFNRIEREGVPVKKGLFELLDFLKSKNIRLALATSTSKQSARKMLKKAEVLGYFDALVCGDDVKVGKPDPEIFLTAAERLGVSPKDCAAFEDSINGIKSAYAAEMVTVMVPDLLQPTEEIKPMISCLCRDLSQSIPFLEKIV